MHTPKYRHGVHTTPADSDMVAIWFGPFTDVYRRDKRMPFVMEMYLDMNPLDAKEMGIEDGDYIYIDADPDDRPYKDWKKDDPFYKVARLLCRARYYPGTPRKVTRMWHNNYCSTIGSVKGHETREDGLAKNPDTNYQAMFRYGSHQSTTRAWLRPTLMTDSLVRKGHVRTDHRKRICAGHSLHQRRSKRRVCKNHKGGTWRNRRQRSMDACNQKHKAHL